MGAMPRSMSVMAQHQRGVNSSHADRPVIHAHHDKAVQGDEISERIRASSVPCLKSCFFHLGRAHFLVLLHGLHSGTCGGRIGGRMRGFAGLDRRGNCLSCGSNSLVRSKRQEARSESLFTKRTTSLSTLRWVSASFQFDRIRREGLQSRRIG